MKKSFLRKIMPALLLGLSVMTIPMQTLAKTKKVDIDTSIEQDRNAGTELYDSKCYYHNVLPLNISVSDGSGASVLQDERYSTSLSLAEGTEIKVTSDTVMTGLYVIWDSIVPEWTLKIGEDSYTYGKYGYLHEYIELPKETTELTIVIPNGANDVERGISKMRIADIIAFDTKDLPAWVQVWEPVCEEADFLVFSTHADDEQLFFGGILPVYQSERNIRVQYAFFTTYWNIPDQHIREHEKLNGLWLAGCKYYPIMGHFDDGWADNYEQAAAAISEDEAQKYLTECIRRTHPQIVVTQDIEGEYGHGQHMFMTGNAIKAVELAKDETYDGDSLSKYGTWDTLKFYIHLYGENQMKFDMRSPLDTFGGKRAIDVARQAYLCHQSQQWCDFSVNDYGPYDAALYGLYSTKVGEDVNHDDFMENIVSYDEQAELKRLEEERIAKEEEERALEEAEKARLEAQKKAEEEEVEPEKEKKGLSFEEIFVLSAVVLGVLMTVGFAVIFVKIQNDKKAKRKRRRR